MCCNMHFVEITDIYSHRFSFLFFFFFCRKFMKATHLLKKSLSLIWRGVFQVRVNFSFFHNAQHSVKLLSFTATLILRETKFIDLWNFQHFEIKILNGQNSSFWALKLPNLISRKILVAAKPINNTVYGNFFTWNQFLIISIPSEMT